MIIKIKIGIGNGNGKEDPYQSNHIVIIITHVGNREWILKQRTP